MLKNITLLSFHYVSKKKNKIHLNIKATLYVFLLEKIKGYGILIREKS